MKNHVFQQKYTITRNERIMANGHNSLLIFFTGLSGSGKSTIACRLEEKLFEKGIKTYVLDGDNIRKGINRNLGFSPEDRSENNRRIGEISKLFIDAGIVVLAAFVSPYRKDRDYIRNTVGTENFVEVFMNTTLEECERRDVKGLYKKARKGEIKNMTGIDAPYEKPLNYDIEILQHLSKEEAASTIFNYIQDKLKLKE